MNGRLRDFVNLLIYGSAFIGLCAAAITALTFELIGILPKHFDYVLLIGLATAALYSSHRVIGLHKLDHVEDMGRYAVIRKYKQHIWLYTIIWFVLSIWFFLKVANLSFVLWLLPGGAIAFAYVLPFLSKGRRLRDLGWMKIIMIGWSWGWLTAFIPAYYFGEASLQMGIIIGLERMLWIIAITIPFEIRDIAVDRSVGLTTLPAQFGTKRTMRTGFVLCIMIILLAMISGFHYFNPTYVYTMIITCILTYWVLKKSLKVHDDYFFSGVIDGLMILAVFIYWTLDKIGL